MAEIPHFNSVDEYVAWCEASGQQYNPQICPRHWWPMIDAYQQDRVASGMLLTVILMQESFAFVPEEATRLYQETGDPTALNSWFANTTTPICCMLGDEKMEWLWWLLSQEHCLARDLDHPQGRPACLFPKEHFGTHMHHLPVQGIFNFMERFPKP